MLKKYIIRIYHFIQILKQIFLKKISLFDFLKYKVARHDSEVNITISDVSLVIRKGTPDLMVALSCLTGEFDLLQYLLPKDYSGIIVDAGGYIGTSAIALNKMYPMASIVVLEPSIKNIDLLKMNVSDIENIEVVHGALIGSRSKSIMLNNRGTGEWGFSVVKRPKDAPDASPIHETPAYRLADLVPNTNEIGLLKLDIEGGEFDLMKNDMIAMKCIPIVFAELHERIIDGVEELFFEFSRDRILIKGAGEKYLSIKY